MTHPAMTDYPAAHSMDSGWFALDEEGCLAHFETGEGGALPEAAKLLTGEAGASSMSDPWTGVVAPWIARQLGTAEELTEGDGFRLDSFENLYALFATPDQAKAAAAAGQYRKVSDNPCLIVFGPDDLEAIRSAEGLIGLAPPHDFFYDRRSDELQSVPIPLYFYDNEFGAPGIYHRVIRGAVPSKEVEVEVDRIPVRFADSEQINLRDCYESEELQWWGEGEIGPDGTVADEPPSELARAASRARGRVEPSVARAVDIWWKLGFAALGLLLIVVLYDQCAR